MAVNIQWLPIGISIASGGAAGAVITAGVSLLHNRQQPVGTTVEVTRLFKNNLGNSTLTTRVTVSDGNVELQYSNLFVGNLIIKNRGNQDIPSFEFGITLNTKDTVIYAESETPDRHHNVHILTPPSPNTPLSEMDFQVEPFNRGDYYKFRIYITVSDDREEPAPMVFSSAQPVRFVEMPTTSQVIAAIADSYVINVGPIAISTRRLLG